MKISAHYCCNLPIILNYIFLRNDKNRLSATFYETIIFYILRDWPFYPLVWGSPIQALDAWVLALENKR